MPSDMILPAPFPAYAIARLPRIVFGAGKINDVPALARGYGRRVLIVTGQASFKGSPLFGRLVLGLEDLDMAYGVFTVPGEPSPKLVDDAVVQFKDGGFDVVLGIGGGSALDAAKAIAGLLRPGTSVMDHLEGVGPELPYAGPAVPFIAVPTTAGTGSEATKNAVLSRQGADGFKKSFRDDALVAEVAVVDPELIKSCPKSVIAANGMDAFTQLLESYVSTRANPLTDALALSGLKSFIEGFWRAYEGGEDEVAQAARSHLAHASLMSGICLAQTGLGSVHGLASPLGAHFPIPHGVVCGTLVAEATAMNVKALHERAESSPALARYTALGNLLADWLERSDEGAQALVGVLREWVTRLDLPRLSAFGVTDDDVERVVANARGSSMKTNPVVLTDDEIAQVVRARL